MQYDDIVDTQLTHHEIAQPYDLVDYGTRHILLQTDSSFSYSYCRVIARE
jgi:hypothetical protein